MKHPKRSYLAAKRARSKHKRPCVCKCMYNMYVPPPPPPPLPVSLPSSATRWLPCLLDGSPRTIQHIFNNLDSRPKTTLSLFLSHAHTLFSNQESPRTCTVLFSPPNQSRKAGKHKLPTISSEISNTYQKTIAGTIPPTFPGIFEEFSRSNKGEQQRIKTKRNGAKISPVNTRKSGRANKKHASPSRAGKGSTSIDAKGSRRVREKRKETVRRPPPSPYPHVHRDHKI